MWTVSAAAWWRIAKALVGKHPDVVRAAEELLIGALQGDNEAEIASKAQRLAVLNAFKQSYRRDH